MPCLHIHLPSLPVFEIAARRIRQKGSTYMGGRAARPFGSSRTLGGVVPWPRRPECLEIGHEMWYSDMISTQTRLASSVSSLLLIGPQQAGSGPVTRFGGERCLSRASSGRLSQKACHARVDHSSSCDAGVFHQRNAEILGFSRNSWSVLTANYASYYEGGLRPPFLYQIGGRIWQHPADFEPMRQPCFF